MRFLILFCLSISVVQARQFEVNQISTEPGFEAIFNLLNTGDNSYRLVLDCQSYFNKYDAFGKNNVKIMENFISTGECYYLWENITTCLEKTGRKCVDSDHLFDESCHCL